MKEDPMWREWKIGGYYPNYFILIIKKILRKYFKKLEKSDYP
jgi:hypothetical protein